MKSTKPNSHYLVKSIAEISPAYKAYQELDEPPEDLPAWQLDSNGWPIITPGEVFCRLPHHGGSICKQRQRRTADLVKHLVSVHKLEETSKIPTPRALEILDRLPAFYEDLMRGNEYDGKPSEASTGQSSSAREYPNVDTEHVQIIPVSEPSEEPASHETTHMKSAYASDMGVMEQQPGPMDVSYENASLLPAYVSTPRTRKWALDGKPIETLRDMTDAQLEVLCEHQRNKAEAQRQRILVEEKIYAQEVDKYQQVRDMIHAKQKQADGEDDITNLLGDARYMTESYLKEQLRREVTRMTTLRERYERDVDVMRMGAERVRSEGNRFHRETQLLKVEEQRNADGWVKLKESYDRVDQIKGRLNVLQQPMGNLMR